MSVQCMLLRHSSERRRPSRLAISSAARTSTRRQQRFLWSASFPSTRHSLLFSPILLLPRVNWLRLRHRFAWILVRPYPSPFLSWFCSGAFSLTLRLSKPNDQACHRRAKIVIPLCLLRRGLSRTHSVI